MEIYLVGGAVRDKLLNLPVKDRDWVVVGAHPQAMLDQGYAQVGKDFPVFLHPDSKEEYALARTERKKGRGYTGFECYAGEDVTLEDDLRRRDLTINALAQDNAGNIIDPYGGRQDLANKVLRHVSEAFSDDPLRILRVARFYARYHHLGFTIADATITLMKNMVAAGEVSDLTAERVWQETERALLEKTPRAYIEALRACDALQVLLPDLNNLFGVPQPEKHHPEIDTGVHTLMVLDQAVALTRDKDRDTQLQVRWAALMHDLGKGKTPAETLPHHYGHEAISDHLAERINKRYKVPKSAARMARLVARYHTHSHKAFELKPTTVMRLLESVDAFRRPDALPIFLLACEADARGRTGFETRDYPQADYIEDCFRAADRVNARAILQTRELRGKALGEEIRKQRIKAIQNIKSDYVSDSS